MNLYGYEIRRDSDLMHHGIIGMKWGVRRYQNFDGSYTKKGLEHYKESMTNYEKARDAHKKVKALYKQSKKNGYVELPGGQQAVIGKNVVKESRQTVKDAKKKLDRDYAQLKKDKSADIGKELYRSGKTITGNENALRVAGLIATGTAIAAKYLNDSGNAKAARYTAYAGVGMEAVNALWSAKNAIEARHLRAYYSHSRSR